ncbi:MAG: VIT domain-containing protein [Bacteroidota bacterium]
MKLNICTLLLLILPVLATSQNNRILNVQEDVAPIILDSVKINIQVVGNMATTITELTFFNPNDRTLEGELNFPLTNQQKVFRFAMDVNGLMREGVVVEKALVQQAFEGVVRQVIDPGLLEQTVGNNYKARVYPIFANDSKSILIGFEEELAGMDNIYRMIAEFGRVNHFSITVKVINAIITPSLTNDGFGETKFEKDGTSFVGEIRRSDFEAIGVFEFKPPAVKKEKIFRQQCSDDDFFYLTTLPPNIEIEKEKPKELAIIWDMSSSMINRDTSKEFDLLRAYMKHLSRAKVQLIGINQAIQFHEFFEIEKGQVDVLIKRLSDVIYDGGTSFESLITMDLKVDEILFFTDGIPNLDRPSNFSFDHLVYLISSSAIIDENYSTHLASLCGGSHINLLNTSPEEALFSLENTSLLYLGATFNPDFISEVYPNTPTIIKPNTTFSLAGKIRVGTDVPITLHFGIPGKTIYKREILITESEESVEIERLWANKKVSDLLQNVDHDKNKVIQVGKTYNLITPHTSLIILESAWDYARYGIDPPPELRKEYDEIISSQDNYLPLSKEVLVEELVYDYMDRVEWWIYNEKDTTTHYSPKVQDSSWVNNYIPLDTLTYDEYFFKEHFGNRIPTIDTTIFDKVIEGRIVDETGEPLIGVAILIQGEEIGTVTDLKGYYRLRVRESDILIFHYTGYDSQELNASEVDKRMLQMSFETLKLSEVVVAGLAPDVSGDSYEVYDNAVSTNRISIEKGANFTRINRGIASISLGAKPLFLVDDKWLNLDEVDILYTEPIISIDVIQPERAISMFGENAKDGVVVIVSRNLSIDEYQLPDSIIAAFDPAFTIKSWNKEEPYLKILREYPVELQFEKYLELKEAYGKEPSFYFSIGQLFLDNRLEEKAFQIFSNIVELDLQNHESLKTLANIYLQYERFEQSIFLFKKVLELRPFEPQSKRDLALAMQAAGQEQEALDLFLEIILDAGVRENYLFPNIQLTVLHEMNNLRASNPSLDISNIPKPLLSDLPVDIRIVVDWNVMETDLDMWITEPTGEKCYYLNELTKIGGRLTEDYTNGYGPEEYILKKAIPGDYKIEVDFYDDRIQKISGPAIVRAAIYTNYGSDNQKVHYITKSLKEEEGTIEIGTIRWDE